ncbi:hypothetical protein cyc_03347 [Cyclospora cayetanensis]|uniref:Uncharacterized protein n=1 Tax=Cyclospora cayetanensis TaxID=88456 RepID=A0A1D3CUJ2_9EIME|nr:hypothetical protein cyc_03347 [Cyclospora cayetanensis]
MPQPEGKGGDGRKSPVLAALPPEAAPARGVEGALRLSEMLAGESWVVTSLCAEGKSVEGREASSGRCNKQGKGCDGSLPNACGVPSTVTSVPLPRTAAVALADVESKGLPMPEEVLGELPVEALAPPKRGSASSLRDGVTLANFMRQSRNTAAAAAARRRKHPEAAATGWEPVASPAEVRAALSNSSDSSNAVALAVATASHEAPILAPGCVAAAARLHAAAASEEAAAADSLHPERQPPLPMSVDAFFEAFVSEDQHSVQQLLQRHQSNMHQLVQQGEFRPLPKKPTETHVHLPGGQPIGYSFVQSPVAIPVKSPQDPASNEITWGMTVGSIAPALLLVVFARGGLCVCFVAPRCRLLRVL